MSGSPDAAAGRWGARGGRRGCPAQAGPVTHPSTRLGGSATQPSAGMRLLPSDGGRIHGEDTGASRVSGYGWATGSARARSGASWPPGGSARRRVPWPPVGGRSCVPHIKAGSSCRPTTTRPSSSRWTPRYDAATPRRRDQRVPPGSLTRSSKCQLTTMYRVWHAQAGRVQPAADSGTP